MEVKGFVKEFQEEGERAVEYARSLTQMHKVIVLNVSGTSDELLDKLAGDTGISEDDTYGWDADDVEFLALQVIEDEEGEAQQLFDDIQAKEDVAIEMWLIDTKTGEIIEEATC